MDCRVLRPGETSVLFNLALWSAETPKGRVRNANAPFTGETGLMERYFLGAL